jgi:protein-lysine N-methyltransferase EEF2KMT
MEHMGRLSAVPVQDEANEAQLLSVHSYYPPLPLEDSGARPILIKEARNLLSRGNNVGLRTWEAALHLAWYLTTQQSSLVNGKNVLELGAGTGLLSLLCAGHLKASSVLATDGLDLVCESLQVNVDLNMESIAYEKTSAPKVLQLDWTDDTAIENLLSDARKAGVTYDLIIGADITYHPDILRPLAKLLSVLESNFPGATILISATIRSDTFAHFTTICQDEFQFVVAEEPVEIPSGLRYAGFFHTIATPIKVVSLNKRRDPATG